METLWKPDIPGWSWIYPDVLCLEFLLPLDLDSVKDAYDRRLNSPWVHSMLSGPRLGY